MSRLTKEELEKRYFGPHSDSIMIDTKMQAECVLLLMEIKELLMKNSDKSAFDMIFGKH